MSRRHRLLGILGLAVRRILGRLRTTSSKQVLLSVLGVALAVTLMTTVSGIALGMGAENAIQSEDVDYWVVPEASTASSVAVDVGSPQLGNTHAITERLDTDERIDYATPVQTQLVRLSPGDGNGSTEEYVLVAGIIPPEKPTKVVGVPTDALEPGDPHYANGTYEGPRTGELVLNEAGAELLGLSASDEVTATVGNSRATFTVTDVRQADVSSGVGPVPVALVHHSELQTMTGSTSGDLADQLLVSTNAAGVKSDIEAVYPRTSVVTQTGLAVRGASTSSLPLAMAAVSLTVAILVGVLFVATMMGLEVNADRRNLAVLSAMGYRTGSQTLLVVAETVIVATIGGVIGVIMGIGGIHLTNAITQEILGVQVALFDPILIGYSVAVAAAIGLISSVYPAWLTWRTPTLEAMSHD
ncbi:ABC transporter permease [Haloferax mediterranei ATCC 33500]|uniref:ABC transporter permease n=1 Tax=Haloferax mediterranei (strain ATCC 33500 / DSM 1411 / JCM 8866 / NBRC 14739 / NCIMB 2177 / R-4) TaxID=523841 RepID=I3R6Q2_HALMT|nr:ABC transporter permease [Haloferax mediterranei]AFK19912.1 ABC transporter permease [Haloferax mediterranei ATCC 33500]AHZ23291.1 ABC transporter permease [Haloferax mediterranei ATCC 33500]ELZ99456.1 ABC transporter permease [Haloferax mediterranei ATCC 33500]MDX5987339.1 ABC transporter permease [Haloferax mediterranei ATCC 33500]QCQ73854.1 ABC transporter permease [Haloferax mediterranei ATCC 33500]